MTNMWFKQIMSSMQLQNSRIQQTRRENMERFPGLDALRCLAFLLTFFLHFSIMSKGQFTSLPQVMGINGSEIAFLLSGFLIGNIIFSPIARGGHLSLKIFYLRRAVRTLPLYLLILSIYFLIPSIREWKSIPPLWKFLTFTQNFGLSRFEAGAFSHAWQTCIEEQFYFILPLIAVPLTYKANFRCTVGIIFFFLAVGMIYRLTRWIQLPPLSVESSEQFKNLYGRLIYYPTFARMDGLIVGATLSLLMVFRPKLWDKLIKKTTFLFFIFIFAAALLSWLYPISYSTMLGVIIYFPLKSIVYGILILLACHHNCLCSKLNSSVFKHIANITYAGFLSHKLVIHSCEVYLSSFGFSPYSIFGFVVALLCSVLVAAALYFLVDYQLLEIRSRLRKKASGL